MTSPPGPRCPFWGLRAPGWRLSGRCPHSLPPWEEDRNPHRPEIAAVCSLRACVLIGLPSVGLGALRWTDPKKAPHPA